LGCAEGLDAVGFWQIVSRISCQVLPEIKCARPPSASFQLSFRSPPLNSPAVNTGQRFRRRCLPVDQQSHLRGKRMKYFSNLSRIATTVVLASAVLSGCAINMKVPVKDPVPSATTFKKTTENVPVKLAFKDERSAEEKAKLVSGRIPMQVVYEDKPFDAVPWLAQHTVKELTARGMPVTLADGRSGGTTVLIKHIHIENHRATGFSPFVTFTSLRAEVLTDRGPQRITSYVKRGKVPVWTFDEVIDPTYNAPLGIMTKEVAAKLNQQLFRQSISDEEVNALIRKIDQDGGKSDDAYLDVYQLGFGNNPRAIPELVKLSSHANEYVRLAAISSLGILKATDQHEFLTRTHENASLLWQDRAMALKAIGDLGTPASRAYLQKQQSQLEGRTDKDATWTKEIIALYL
jgi:hypothetical protein